jgi:glyoxylase-like metal-dependent hydrolase (beta-lactamase superfamily II)
MTTTALPTGFQSIDDRLPLPTLDETPAAALRRVKAQAPEFREWFRQTGTLQAVATRSLVTLPYPREFALWEACTARTKFVWMTNRMFVVQWQEGGHTRTLLAEPSDYELGVDTPYLRHAIDRLPMSEERALKLLFVRYPSVTEQLETLGIAPEDVDYLVFDHLHTQDIRRLVGTTTPQPDLGYADGPVPALFPNAKMIVQRTELAHVRDAHPFQARFHQPWTYDGIDESKLLVVDGSVLVAPGLALLRTPGHTLGNHTIVLNTEQRGILTSSENGVAVESYAPRYSRLPGVAAFAKRWGYEVILNFNTPEWASWQYNSMVAESLIADPVPGAEHFKQVVPSSELVRHRLAPRVHPTFRHGDLTIGTLTPTAGRP